MWVAAGGDQVHAIDPGCAAGRRPGHARWAGWKRRLRHRQAHAGQAAPAGWRYRWLRVRWLRSGRPGTSLAAAGCTAALDALTVTGLQGGLLGQGGKRQAGEQGGQGEQGKAMACASACAEQVSWCLGMWGGVFAAGREAVQTVWRPAAGETAGRTREKYPVRPAAGRAEVEAPRALKPVLVPAGN